MYNVSNQLLSKIEACPVVCVVNEAVVCGTEEVAKLEGI